MALVLVFIFSLKLAGKGIGSTTTTSAFIKINNKKINNYTKKQKTMPMPGFNIMIKRRHTYYQVISLLFYFCSNE